MTVDSAFWREMADRFEKLPHPSRLAAVLGGGKWGVTDGSASERQVFKSLATRAGIAAGVSGLDGWLNLLWGKGTHCVAPWHDKSDGGWIPNPAEASAGYCEELQTLAFEQEHAAPLHPDVLAEVSAEGSTGEVFVVDEISAALQRGDKEGRAAAVELRRKAEQVTVRELYLAAFERDGIFRADNTKRTAYDRWRAGRKPPRWAHHAMTAHLTRPFPIPVGPPVKMPI
ncbi:MAG TPA: hypothetical protein VGK29_01885 [Paludibaculum sp.]|jgi:hypothetical protein